jgi:hypothetical protein
MMLAGAGTEDGGWSWVIWWRRAVGAVADSQAPGESGFEDWGRDEFAFLAGHGFVVDRVTRHTIQWRKSGRTIELSRDWRDGQLDLRFVCGTGPSDRRAFGLHEALQVVATEAWPSHGWQAWRQPTTRKYIAELAALVRAHLAAFLSNGAELWHRAGDLARGQALAYGTGSRAAQLRRQADEARQAGDWPAVIDRYEQLQAMGVPLKESEVMRLQYARKHS